MIPGTTPAGRTEGEIRAPSDDIVGGETDARAAATTAARMSDTVRENDTGRSTPEPVRAPSAADVNN